MKKLAAVLTVIALLLTITACNARTEKQNYERHTANFLDTFDTVVQVIGYTKSKEEFTEYAGYIHQRFQEFHRLYDKYNEYEGINNIKTINDNAGIKPVKVDQEIINLILLCKVWHGRTDGKANIAIGSLLDIWDEKIRQAAGKPGQQTLPTAAELKAAAKHINIDDIIVDQENMTVFLAHKGMSLDLGAIGKGYAAEIVGREMVEKGFTSGVIMSGGNWKVLGKPHRSDRDHWVVGVQNPDHPHSLGEEGIIKRVAIKNESLDSSGDYQRYAIIEGVRVHHIIDPDTLMPGNYYRGVTVVADDSGMADILTTGLFLLPYERGRALVDSLDGVEALWIMQDKTIEATDGMLKRLISTP